MLFFLGLFSLKLYFYFSFTFYAWVNIPFVNHLSHGPILALEDVNISFSFFSLSLYTIRPFMEIRTNILILRIHTVYVYVYVCLSVCKCYELFHCSLFFSFFSFVGSLQFLKACGRRHSSSRQKNEACVRDRELAMARWSPYDNNGGYTSK